MAGVVAMASVIEDFETQPCKKSRKDGDSPVVKTITNYFSPMPKEKPFSPPKSNNIMDYFSRKTPPARENSNTPEQIKENRHKPQPFEALGHPESTERQQGKQPQKRGRKPSKAARQLQKVDAMGSTEDCVICEGLIDEGDPADKAVRSSGILGSDTAALLAQISYDACVAGEMSDGDDTGTVSAEKAQNNKHHEGDLKRGAPVKQKQGETCDGSLPKVPPRDKVKRGRPKGKKGKAKQQQVEEKECVPEVKEAELSLCNASMEVNVDEASRLNGSTITISFEDFLQSQGEKEGENIVNLEPEEKEDVSNASENGGPKDPPCPQQVSPRTLTIQAEVHANSHKHEPVRAVEKKMASIFTKKKEQDSAAEVKTASSPHPQVRLELLPAPKRKSNVVLQEEDLELDVVESDSTPKCTQVERKQFMSAFKQPSVEGAKTKPGKSLGKQKQPSEMESAEAVDEAAEKASNSVPAAEQANADSAGGKRAKKKPARRGRKKVQEEKSVPSPATQEEPVPMETNEGSDAKAAEEPTTTSTPTVRRSKRDVSLRQTPVTQSETVTPALKTKSQERTKAAAVPQDTPLQMSTPKTHRSKHRVFMAEVLCPADEKESPIRMRFTRVFSNSKSEGGSDFEILSPLPTKGSNASKKRKQAKKLVEKARAIQQSKKAAAEEKDSLRRSSRSLPSTKKSYCENEDSVVFLGEENKGSAQAAQEKGKPQKRLRSMNDVLGRNVAMGKEGKNPAASKVAHLFQGKKAQKTAVISIFDESSHEGSENSQDDEQFRARKEFLKSGLPESFKKQIAKTAATKEAYTVSCSSFQPLVHVLQTPQDCPLWSLPWPVSQLLQCLKKLHCLPSKPLPSLDGLSCCRTVSASRVHRERGSGWREEFSEPVRKLLMGEISASNPPFPVQRYLTRFLKRRTDHLIQCTTSEPDPITRVPSAPVPAEAVGGKRKRMDEGEVPGKVAKKQRSSKLSEEKTIVIIDHPSTEPTGDTSTPEPEPPRRGGRRSRAQRCKQQQEEAAAAKPSVENTPLSSQSDLVVLLDDFPLAENSGKEDLVKEDVLWTEKYQPQHSSDVIGNTGSVRRLHSWLKEWKLRADREERKKQKEKKQEEGSNDSWDCEEGDSQEGEDLVSNTLLITGPTGVGKTAAVYACAQELGFKVFEVNASSQRSGRQILSQLKEATQSHQVDIQGVNAHKPCYFNSYSSSSVRPGISPRKVNSPRRVVSSPRKAPQSPRGPKRGGLTPTSLASYFKMGRPTNKEPGNQDKKQQADPKKTTKAKESAIKTTKDPPKEPPASKKESSSEEQGKKTATSLILFEEVDVIFDDDSGFLAAIKTFMTTTKRPVILTTSDPTFSAMFDGYLEEIHFKAPSVVNVVSYLQLLCLAENMRTDTRDISSLLSLNRCNIRQSLLHLQFWTRSAGGRQLARPIPDSAPTAAVLQLKTEESAEAVETGSVCEGATPTPLPPCDTGCTESLLGLLNVEPERDVHDLLKSQSTVEQSCLELLTESRRSGVDLLYSNMAALLPLPVTDLTITAYKPTQEVVNRTQEEPSTEPQDVVSMGPQTESRQQTDPLAHPMLLQVAEGSDDGSPVKVSSRMKRKKQYCLEDQDLFHSDSDSDDAFLSLRKPQSAPQTASQSEDNTTDKEEEPQTGKKVAKASVPVPMTMRRMPLTPEQRMKSEPVSHCLGSLAEFLDHMSFLDASLHFQTPHTGGARETHMFGLTGRSEIKDGMTDEPREGCDGGSWAERVRVAEIQASVEALSFQRCRTGVAEAWGRAQALEGELGKEAVMELTLPVAQHRQAFSLTQDSPCEPKVLQRRREVMDTVLSSRGFGTLGNRPAVAVDYLPSLRAICRSETLKEQGKVKRRFLHYLDAIHLGLSKSTVRHLAEDFP